MKKEAQEKARKTKAENNKVLFEIYGYKVSRSPLEFTASGNGVIWHYMTLVSCLRDLNQVTNDKKLESGIKVSELVENLESRDKVFLRALAKILGASYDL